MITYHEFLTVDRFLEDRTIADLLRYRKGQFNMQERENANYALFPSDFLHAVQKGAAELLS